MEEARIRDPINLEHDRAELRQYFKEVQPKLDGTAPVLKEGEFCYLPNARSMVIHGYAGPFRYDDHWRAPGTYRHGVPSEHGSRGMMCQLIEHVNSAGNWIGGVIAPLSVEEIQFEQVRVLADGELQNDRKNAVRLVARAGQAVGDVPRYQREFTLASIEWNLAQANPVADMSQRLESIKASTGRGV